MLRARLWWSLLALALVRSMEPGAENMETMPAAPPPAEQAAPPPPAVPPLAASGTASNAAAAAFLGSRGCQCVAFDGQYAHV